MEFKKYAGCGEYIFVAKEGSKWVSYCDYHSKPKIFTDDYIKELLFNKLKEMNNEYSI